MKKLFSLILSGTLMAACSSNKHASSSSDSISQNDSSLNASTNCYQRLEGNLNQDTSFLTLTITGTEVTGILNHLPYEKDSRKGTIKGSLEGDLIKAEWYFMQEGMNDTLPLEFKMTNGQLLQKTFGIDMKTGRQVLTDTSTFSIPYKKINCN